MRLVQPSPGECADRLTILELKIEFGIKREIDTSHFQEEYDQINKYLGVDKTIALSVYYTEMQRVNRGLWMLEGELRHQDAWKQHPELAVAILTEITRLNDRRAELVNKLDGGAAKEKLY